MQYTLIHFKWAPLLTLFALFQLTGCFNNLRPELGRSCDSEATQNTCNAEFKCVYINALDAGRCVPTGTDKDDINAAYEEDISGETDEASVTDAGSSVGTTTEDAGSSDGTMTEDAGTSDGTMTEDAGSSDGTMTEDAGSSDGTTTEDAGSSDGTVVADAGNTDVIIDSGPQPCQNTCDSGYTQNELSCACDDINECDPSTDTELCGFGTCDNTVGSYSCRCDDGYLFNDQTCEYVPPEGINNVACSPDAALNDQMVCECKIGYFGNFDWNTTTLEWTGSCTQALVPEHSTCVEQAAILQCSCIEGYTQTLVNGITWDSVDNVWLGECTATLGPYECAASATCSVIFNNVIKMGRNQSCSDYDSTSTCMSDTECADNHYCLFLGATSNCVQPCGDIMAPTNVHTSDPNDTFTVNDNAEIYWDGIQDVTQYQVRLTETISGVTNDTTYDDVSGVESYLIPFNTDYIAGTTLAVCIAAVIDNIYGDPSCIIITYEAGEEEHEWEDPCVEDANTQLPTLSQGQAINLPNGWGLDEKNYWELELAIKIKEPQYAPTTILEFKNHKIQVQKDPTNTTWTFSEVSNPDPPLQTKAFALEANTWQILRIQRAEGLISIQINEDEFLFDNVSYTLGTGDTIGPYSTIQNPGADTVHLGFVYAEIGSQIFHYEMEDVEVNQSAIEAMAEDDTIIYGYALTPVPIDGNAVFNVQSACEGGGGNDSPAECPDRPSSLTANSGVFFDEQGADFVVDLNSILNVMPGDYVPTYTSSFLFIADSSYANDFEPKNILTIGPINNPRLRLRFQRETAGGSVTRTFSLVTRVNDTNVCTATASISQAGDSETEMKIAFQYELDPTNSVLNLNVNNTHVVGTCTNPLGALPTLAPNSWIFAGTQNDDGSASFAMDDLRVWKGIENALTVTNLDCFFGPCSNNVSTANAYFDFNTYSNFNENTCELRFTDSMNNNVFGNAHYVEIDDWDGP